MIPRARLVTVILGGGAVPAPDAPTGLTATPASTTQINLAWTDNATNETGYKVYRSTNGVDYSELDDIAVNSVTYNDTTISAGTLYYYKVSAYNGGGESDLSGAAAALVLQPNAASGLETQIQDTAPTYNFGISALFRAGQFTGTTIKIRGLLKFSDISLLPANATINSAQVKLNCETEASTTDRNVAIHRALTQWFEGAKDTAVPDVGQDGSTWNLRNANGSVAWAGGAGGGSGSDYTAAATDTVLITAPGVFTWNVAADVQDFVDGAATNHGWWLIGDQVNADSGKRFTASDGATPANRPILMVSVNP